MKTTNLILLILCLVAAAFVIGQLSQRLATTQEYVSGLESRVCQLEDSKARGEARWRWLARIGKFVALVAHFFRRN